MPKRIYNFFSGSACEDRQPLEHLYPRTLIFENESTARPGVGRPIDIAGRNVVKISMLFTSGQQLCDRPDRK